MNSTIRVVFLFIVALMLTVASVGFVSGSDQVRQLTWDDLVPPDWNPRAGLASDLDGDPRSEVDGTPGPEDQTQAYQETRNSPPLVVGLDGQAVRIPGLVVPLDFDGTLLSEFLLVPYHGACIHVPPPPANQVVYVKSAPFKLEKLFQAVWVTGTMHTELYQHRLAEAGYRMTSAVVEPYE
jgi:hypothetical protein